MKHDEKQRKRLLIVSSCFYPSVNRGGPVVSVTNLAIMLANKMDVSVLTTSYESGTGEAFSEIHDGKNRLFQCDVYYLKESSPKGVKQAIAEAAPEIIYISSLFSAAYTLPALAYAKEKRIRAVLAPRGELQPGALRRKALKKILYLTAVKCSGLTEHLSFHATSAEEEAEIKKHFPNAPVFKAQNLIAPKDRRPRTREKQPGELRAVAVCRVHPIKGLDRAIEALKPLRGQIYYDIYGPVEDEGFFNRCTTLVQQLPPNVTVQFHGAAAQDQLARAVADADVFLMPTKTENFGNAIVEALMNGCPTVISDATPWKKLSENKAGFDLPDDGDYTSALQMFTDMNEREWKRWSVGASEYIQSRLNTEQTIATYLRMLEG